MQLSSAEFESLYKRSFPPSLKLAVGMLHNVDDARDIVNEVFLKLLEKDVNIVSPEAFVLRSVRNACLNRINMLSTRDRILNGLTISRTVEELDSEVSAEALLFAVETLLTARERQVIKKIYDEDMSYKEASASMDVSVSAVNKYLVSALKKLREYFKVTKS